MGAKLLTAACQILARVLVQIAAGGRQAAATMFVWDAAERPQRVLQPFRQCHEALATEHDMGVREAGIGKPEMIEPVIESLAGTG